MISKVELKGFKGIYSTFKLQRLNLLVGPNGSGKSAVGEAIRYALSGKVRGDTETDKALRFVSRYFVKGSGSVVVTSNEDVLKRGVKQKRDGSFTEILDCEKGWPYLDEGINFEEFLNLSPDKRRTKILGLFKEDTLEASELIHLTFESYLLSLTGKKDDRDSSPVTQKFVSYFRNPSHGISIHLLGCVAPGMSKGAFILKCQDLAQEKKKTIGVDLRDVQAKREQLQGQLKESGSKVNFQELKKVLAEKQEHRDNIDRQIAKKITLKETIDRTREKLVILERQFQDQSNQYERVKKELPKEPEKPVFEIVNEKVSQVARVRHAKEQLEEKIKVISKLREEKMSMRQLYQVTTSQLEGLHESPLGKLEAVYNNRPEVLKNIEWEGWEIIHAVLKHVKLQIKNIESSIQEIEKREKELDEKLDLQLHDFTEREPEEELLILKNQLFQYEKQVADIEQRNRMAENQYSTFMRKYKDSQDVHETYKINLRLAEREVLECRKHLQEKEQESGALANFDSFQAREQSETLRKDIETLREAIAENSFISDLQFQLEEKDKELSDLAFQEAAWSHVIIALKVVRDNFIESKSIAFIRKANQLLEISGLKERIYIEFEDFKNRPTFEMGMYWPNGRRVAFSALSSGQRLLMATALSSAFYAFSRVLKIVMLEADSLDAENLPRLLDGVTRISENFLDLVLVSTCHKTKVPAGWQVIQF